MKTLFKNSRSYVIVTTGQSVASIVGRTKSNEKINRVIADITDFCEQYVDVSKEFIDSNSVRTCEKNVDVYHKVVRGLVELYSKWPEEQIQAAAKRLCGIVGDYKRFGSKSLKEKTISAMSMTTDLNKVENQADVKLIPGLEQAVARFTEVSETLESLNYEYEGKIVARMSQVKARKIVRDIVDVINNELMPLLVVAAMDDPETFKPILTDVENAIELSNDDFRSRRAKKTE